MTQIRSLKLAIAVVALALAAHSDASAQATRTWVSGVGDDVNPCSRTAPCKTFAGAISKTADGGEINCIDAGGFGAVTITKSITIDGGESFASILASGTNGIIINDATPAGSVVTLRNLSINAGTAALPGLNGIRFLGGETLHVENCVIFGFSQNGIDVSPAPATAQTFSLFVLDTVIRNCATVANTAGILLKPGVNGTVNASLDGVKLNQNKGTGLRAEVRSNATIRNSVISGNTSNGVLALAAGAAVAVENCVVSGNNPGLQSNGAQATIRCSNVSIFNSGAFGGILAAGGRYVSFSNNKIDNTAGNDFPGGGLTTVIIQK